MLNAAPFLPFPLEILFVSLLGLVLGSFASALAYRAPRGLSWGAGKASCRSACPSCDHKLSALDLVPLFSWLFLRGRCQYCRAPVSVSYPLAEALSLLMVLGVYAVFGFSVQAALIALAVPFLVALLLVDFEHMILPNSLVAGVFVSGLLVHAWNAIEGNLALEDILQTYLAAAFLYGSILWSLGWIMQKILRKEALGFGDVKFFAVCGFWLGVAPLHSLCLIAGAGGLFLGGVWKVAFKQDVFPFGPSLILGFYGVLLLRGAGVL